VLDAMGLDVHIAESLADLFQRAQEGDFALIVTDFWGNDQVGLGETERRVISRLGRLAPTVLLTARAWARDESAGTLGVVRFLSKPFTIEDLEEAVHACTALRRD